jgi:hypothetical protein
MHPLVVISYNNHVYLENTLSQARRFGLSALVVDNASDYKPTRTFLGSLNTDVEVIRLPNNFGYTSWTRPEIYDRLPDRFFLTDPDLQWNAALPADFARQLDEISLAYSAQRVGFALDLSDHTDMFQDADYHNGQSIHTWERPFWNRRLTSSTHEMYDAPIDTTFQLFDKTKPHGVQIRVAGNFTAKHLPWYRQSPICPHDRMHMYISSRTSTTAKLVLREMVATGDLKIALDECQRSCSTPITESIQNIQRRVRWVQ